MSVQPVSTYLQVHCAVVTNYRGSDGTEDCTKVMQGIWYGLGAALRMSNLIQSFLQSLLLCSNIYL
jgi:hypothetical protein